MVNMKTDGINDYDKNDLCKSVENSFYDDVPNLGSVITLDNKGRLINSQFSKPSSSQTLLKLNSSEEVPDADDLPYAVISYGDTPNAMKLPYNDHNYVGSLSNKNLENYDKKALEYTTKQTIQYSQRSNFPTATNLRISHFSSFNSNCLPQNDSVNRTENIFFNEKSKLNSSNQYNFNHNNLNTLTPLNANKSINNHPIQHQIQQLQPTNNGFIAKKQILSNAIVINSNNVNKLKGMSVIKLQRSNLESNISNNISITEPRIINVPSQIKKTNLSNVIVTNDPISVGTGGVVSGSGMDGEIINPGADNKSDKTINLIPRCICGFTHDDGGMIRCEICQTWQHIICMYPDNKFPILYKCEKCEPREIDYHRAIATQTNNLRKAGQNASDFLVNHEYQDYENENSTETSSISKSHNTPQYVIVQPEMKASYRHIHDSIHTTPNQIYITNSKDSQLVPPGSPRTSKRKQDLISLKTVLTKPNSATPGSFTVNNIVIHNSNELQKSLIHNQMNYNCLPNYLIPTSTSPSQLLVEQRPREINETSNKLKYILCNKSQSHTNLTLQQEQYLRLNNFVIHPNHSYEVFRVKFNQHVSNVIRSIVELSCSEIIMEYNGFISLAEDYNKEYDFRKHYNPFALFYDKCDHLSLCIDAKETNSECKYIRRSCTPNAEVKHRLTSNGQIRFYIVPINRISKDVEITIGFDFNYMKCRYQVECACNQASCELIYMRMEEARSKNMANLAGQLNEYDSAVYGEQMKNVTVLTRPHKKRGRAAKILNTSNRQTNIDKSVTIDGNSTTIVRRNKRGRPPLNRPNGIQRADVCLKTSSDSSSNNCLTEFKEASDNESIHGRTNENIHPNLSLHSNFKNFKRISSSHWSLKAHRKLCASMSKNSKTHKNIITQKVGRPLKYKKEKTTETKKDIDYSSDPASSPERYNGTEKSFDGDVHMSSNEEYERTMFQYPGDMMREEEGKYWLEEINNKIYKQKLKEAKKVKRKNRIEKNLSQKLINIKSHHHSSYKEEPAIEREPEPEPKNDEIDLVVSQKETIQEIPIDEEVDVKPPTSPAVESTKDKKHSHLNLICRTKRGRKSLKNNKSYIVSYKTSNIDDLKNDLMLISASLEEEPEPESESKPIITEKLEDEFPTNNVNITMETDETERNLSDSFETKKSSTDMEMEFNNNKFMKSSEEKLHMSYKSKYRKSISNKTTESSKDALKASREERWVNIMWQRILKSENSDNKSKRKRSKSSVADESNPSEENLNDGHELSSPKFGDSDFCDDNLSCENKDQESCYKLVPSTCKSRRRINKLKSSSFSDNDKSTSFSKSSEITTEIKTEISIASISIEENDIKNHMDSQMSEQCGLIVYKEQQSNPMEKFSRENSARLFNENYSEGFTLSTNSGTNHPPHAKKRWLSQALLEENLNENTTSKSNDILNDLFTEKFSNIENSSKHSFLPPVITTVDSTAFTLTPQKVAMNPKKRLLNQFSMEDNAFRVSASDVCGEYKSNKWDQNIDQEQSKTKLTLSEYRKRRYCDKSSKSANDSVSGNKILCDINNEWVSLNTKHSYLTETNNTKEKCVSVVNNSIFSSRSANDIQSQSTGNQNYKYTDSLNKLDIVSGSTFHSKPSDEVNEQQESLSYLNTLNNLRMPGNLDPRLTKSMAFASGKQLPRAHQLIESLEKSVYSSSSNVVLHQPCPRSPDETPNSESDWKLISCNDRGPRTPSDIDDLSVNRNIENDCISAYAPSLESIDTFESQPSPTSDSHFDFDRSDQISCKDNKKSLSVCESSALNDWTNHSTTIGKMAGIQNPDLLQEIEEFDDEYVPLPEKLPERSKEEMETLLLTQKRDSQIREWQEVRQLEREKVKLEHQVRSMQRRMQRVTTKNIGESKPIPSSKLINDDEQTDVGFVLMNTTDDEKTMKIFNVQLSNLNDRLIQQIHIAKNNNDKSSKTSVLQPLTPSIIDLPQSYRLQPDTVDIGVVSKNQTNSDENPNDSNSTSSQAVAYSKFRKRWNNDKLTSQKLLQTSPEDVLPCNPQVSSCISSQTQSDLPFTFITQPKIELLPGVSVTGNSSIPPSISDHVPNFQSVYPEMTSAFM